MNMPLSASTACTRCSRAEVTHEQAREAGAEPSTALSQSRLSAVPCGAQWEPSRQTTLSLPDLQDLLWGNARHADVRVEDPSCGAGPSAVDRDATRQLAGGRRDHGAHIRDDQRMARVGRRRMPWP